MIIGIWGTAASALLGIAISLGAILSAPHGDSTPTLDVILATIVSDAALLGYLGYLGHRQRLVDQAHKAELQRRISEITVLHEVSSTAHDLKSEDALQNVVEIVTKFMSFQRTDIHNMFFQTVPADILQELGCVGVLMSCYGC